MTPAGSPEAGVADAGSGTTYTVKSGDTLHKIARKFGVSVKAIEAENNMSTTRITVGKKLKIPARAEAAAPAAPVAAPVSTPAPEPAPSTVPAPAPTPTAPPTAPSGT
jgi:LysM repeat protein